MKEGDVVIGRCSSPFAAVSQRHLTHLSTLGHSSLALLVTNDQFYGTQIYSNSIMESTCAPIVMIKNTFLYRNCAFLKYIELYVMHFIVTHSGRKNLNVIQVNFKNRI